MSSSRTETSTAVGVSVSESPDMQALGLSDGHLRDAMAEIALQVLSSGTSLACGGDLRQHGFTEVLAELVGRYQDHPRHSGTIVVTDYLAWPAHIRMTSNEIAVFSAEHEPAARLVFLGPDGARLAREQRLKLPAHEPNKDEWTKGLTAMRTVMCGDIQARIVLGAGWRATRGRCPESPRRPVSRSKPVSRSSCSADSAGALATLRRRSASLSVGPARAVTGRGESAFESIRRTTSRTVFPGRKTSSWPGHPISRRRSPSCPAVSVESSAMKLPTHQVFIRDHRVNDQCCKEARVVFGEGHSIFVDRSADPGDIPDEWTDRQILREIGDAHLGDSTVIIVFADGSRCSVSPTTDSSPRPPVPPPGGCRRNPTMPSPPSARGRSRAFAVPVCRCGLAVDGEAEGVVLDDVWCGVRRSLAGAGVGWSLRRNW